MLIDKVLEMDAKTVEARIRARHSGDQRMMDMLKVILVRRFKMSSFPLNENNCTNLSQAVYDFCEPVDEVEEKIVRVRVELEMNPQDVAREVLGKVN